MPDHSTWMLRRTQQIQIQRAHNGSVTVSARHPGEDIKPHITIITVHQRLNGREMDSTGLAATRVGRGYSYSCCSTEEGQIFGSTAPAKNCQTGVSEPL